MTLMRHASGAEKDGGDMDRDRSDGGVVKEELRHMHVRRGVR
jgi:hypothetical protein